MKKIIKRISTFVIALAMVLTCAPAIQAKADETYYVIGGDEAFGSWNLDNAKEMTKSGDVYTYSFTVTKNKNYEFAILPARSWDVQIKDNGQNFKCYAPADGTATIKLDATTKTVTYTGLKKGPAPSDVYYIVGNLEAIGNWVSTKAPKMEKNGDVFSYTFDVTVKEAAATFQKKLAFCFIPTTVDPECWNGKIGNFEYEVTKDGTLTVKFDVSKEGDERVSYDFEAASSGNAGQGSGDAGQGSGDAGQGSGDAGQGSGNAGQGSGDAGQGSGDATNDKADKNTVKIYAKVSSEWETVNAYAWKDGEGFYKVAEWPGTAMTSLGDGWYVIEIPTDINSIIFNNGNGVQTDNITLTAGKTAAFTVAADGKFEETNVPLNYKGGDNNNMVVYIMMMLAGAGLAAVAIAKRRQATK